MRCGSVERSVCHCKFCKAHTPNLLRHNYQSGPGTEPHWHSVPVLLLTYDKIAVDFANRLPQMPPCVRGTPCPALVPQAPMKIVSCGAP
jgi:hypothetical protein